MKTLISVVSDKKIYLFLVPLFFFAFALILASEVNTYYSWMIDPEYGYLINGLNLAQPSFVIGFTDNPGTTVQIICAIVIRVVHIFHGKQSLIDDVLKNPELYLSSIVFVLQVLNTILLYYLGRVVYKSTGKIYFAIFLQLTPLVSQMSILTLNRLNPEQLTISIVIIFIILFFKYLYPDKNMNKNSILKHIIWFSVLMGLSIATKLTLLSLVFIPLFLLPNLKNRIIYIGFTLLSFIVFLIPVFINGKGFINWGVNLITHTGKYGSGENKILDLDLFMSHLKLILFRDILFDIVLLLSIILIVLYFIPKLKLKEKNDTFFRLLLGIIVAIIVQIFLVAKHFGFNYLLPIQLFSMFLIFLMIIILSRRFFLFRNDNIKAILVSVFFIGTFLLNGIGLLLATPKARLKINNTTETIQFIKRHIISKPTIIVPAPYSAAYPEWGLKWGQYYSGCMYKTYAKHLEKIYPGKFILSPDNSILRSWSKDVNFNDIIKKYKVMYLYFGESMGKYKTKLLDNCSQAGTIENIYSNKNTGETIYKIILSANSILNKPVKSVNLIAFNDKFVSDDIGHNYIVIADKNKAQRWENLNLIFIDSNKVVLSTFENKYISADIGSDCSLTAFRTKTSRWEIYTLIKLTKNYVAFKAANNKYLTVDNKSLQLFAKSDSIGEKEMFKLIIKK